MKMKSLEVYMIKKISQAPYLWAFGIVAFFGIIGQLGMVFYETSTTMSLATAGVAMVVASFIFMLGALKFYAKHDLAK